MHIFFDPFSLSPIWRQFKAWFLMAFLFHLALLAPVKVLSKEQNKDLFAYKAVEQIKKRSSKIRLDPEEMRLPKGWDLPFSISKVRAFFDDPFDIPPVTTDWADRVEKAKTLSDLYHVGFDILTTSHTPITNASQKLNLKIPKDVPIQVKPAIRKIYQGIQEATPLLNEAVGSLSKEDQNYFLTLYGWSEITDGKMTQEISSREIKNKYEKMDLFKQDKLLQAGAVLFNGIDSGLTKLDAVNPTFESRIRFKSDHGDILISGTQDDIYEEGDLKDVVLLIDLGGNNKYLDMVGSALNNEIRVAIDLGENITVETDEKRVPNAGSGIFGIGAFILPNPNGIKEMSTYSLGQGCGLAGIGALVIEGQASLESVRRSQGFGSFGVGILKINKGNNSNLLIERDGQGFGMAKGVGILLHKGNQSKIQGGLVQPDPREPQGAVSMVQGVGFGRRAYTGGGVGMAIVHGDNNSVQASYFAQGSGYWHALGFFRLRGKENIVQSRRYNQGSGIHQAFGHFQLFGNKNRVLSWGGGPMNGWDAGIGSALVKGSDNEFQNTWGGGEAAIGALSYSYFEGDRNKFLIPGFGRGRYYHGRLAYSLHVLNGNDFLFQAGKSSYKPEGSVNRMENPWGLFWANDILFEENLNLSPPVWPELRQAQAIEREQVNLQMRIGEADTKSAVDRIADLLDVAAAFSLDKDSPKDATRRLLMLEDKDLPTLIDVIEPAATDQIINVWPILAAYGDTLSQLILAKLDQETSRKKTLLVRQLSLHRPSIIIPLLLNEAKNNPTEKERLSVVLTLGDIVNMDTGQEPGKRALLKAAKTYLQKPSKKNKKNLEMFLARIRPAKGFGLLSNCLELDQNDRIRFFKSLPPGILDLLNHKESNAIPVFIEMLKERREEALSRTTEDINSLEKLEASLKPILDEMLDSSKLKEVKIALSMLGRMADTNDLSKIKPFILHSTASIREVAAVALGRMGEAAVPYLDSLMDNGSSQTRESIMASLPHATSKKSLILWKKGLEDPNPSVRLAAMSTLYSLSPALRPYQKKFDKKLKRKLKKETNPDVRLAIHLMP